MARRRRKKQGLYCVEQKTSSGWRKVPRTCFSTKDDARLRLMTTRKKRSGKFRVQLRGLAGARRAGLGSARRSGLAGCDATTVRELRLYGENDSGIYRSRYLPIVKNLRTKMARGTYDHEKAAKAFKYWADDVAKKYTREFSSRGPHGAYGGFTAEDRRCLAKEMADDFHAQAKGGEFDYLLPKKYRR
jgi:hypothetical protein